MQYDWCAPPSVPAPTYMDAAVRLVLRNVIGFSCLYTGNALARTVSFVAEDCVRTRLPTKPCAPKLLNSALVFTASGLLVSLGVPTLLTALKL